MAEEPIRQTVLLVDDEASVRLYVTTVLRREGFQVLEAADGVDALAMLREIRGAVDVLVTDIKMPRMTGIELVNAAKIAFPGIPVVYISGEHLKQELHSPQHRVAFLQKPFLPQAVLDAVREVIPRTTTASGFGA
jgi:two-component system cell cycle sensor histidine kinase/response regulator CckA